MGKKKMQSPSSINTYLQCPRKYFYMYKLKMPTKPSIHLVRGSAAHLALEKMYELLPEVISENYVADLQTIALELLKQAWEESQDEFAVLDLTPDQINEYYEETKNMIRNFVTYISRRIDAYMQKEGVDFPQAFRALSPQVEKEYLSWDHYTKGFVDVIEQHDGKIRLMDYKTSKRAKINDAYKLQLAIYALLYQQEHGKLPDEVGIYFLKFPQPELTLPVDEELVKHAQFNIEQIHASTQSDNIGDYPMHKSPLCKWSSGQCDFYEYCYEGKPIPQKPLKREYKKKG